MATPVAVLEQGRLGREDRLDRHAVARRAQLFAKRAIDIAVALVVLVATVPIFLVVAIAIVVESRGPIFYNADRVGRHGRRLRMYKFRKMHPGAGGLRLTVGGDPRLTRVGALLARTKLDELPQFINVLRGDMSLIGPRPEDPGFVAAREDDYEEILQVRPGITGLSQIAFADEANILASDDPLAHYLARIMPQKMALDTMYVHGLSLWLDVRILLWTTIAIVLRRPVAVNRSTGAMNLRRRKAEAPRRLSLRRATVEARQPVE